MGRGQQTIAADRFGAVFGNKRGHKDRDLERYVGDVCPEVLRLTDTVMDALFGRHLFRPELDSLLIRSEAERDFRKEVKATGRVLSEEESVSLAGEAMVRASARELAQKVRLSGPAIVKKTVGTEGYSRWMRYQRDLPSEQGVRLERTSARAAEMVTEGTMEQVLREAQVMRLSENRPVNQTTSNYLRRVATKAGLEEASSATAA